MGAANKHYKMKKEESLEATLLALHLPEEKKRTLCGRRRTAEPKGGRRNCCWATLPLDLTNTTVAELSKSNMRNTNGNYKVKKEDS